ncbi:hypothetical protein E2C01_088824 [Portunus trituberculatus]|uniref:Uncharacterized protein n=1 Tax=Portunus trituberculatus TaxID=210409 RepID=A0A5B7JMX8_PORTR|nr:hypothetical protein [Portunus trituberculatus]
MQPSLPCTRYASCAADESGSTAGEPRCAVRAETAVRIITLTRVAAAARARRRSSGGTQRGFRHPHVIRLFMRRGCSTERRRPPRRLVAKEAGALWPDTCRLSTQVAVMLSHRCGH